MAKAKQSGQTGRFIHYEPERIDYAVSDAELEKLRKGEHPIWKDVCLVTLALAVPTLVNAVVEINHQPEFKLTLAIFLNLVFGVSSFIASCITGLAWYVQKKGFNSVIDAIRRKPKFEIPPGVLEVGPLSRDPDQKRNDPTGSN